MASFRATVGRHPRILVVEDDPDLRSALVELLQEEGYDVAVAANGEEALTELAAIAAPNAILLDLAMPVMDGWTFRTRQRSDPRLAAIPTVVISGSHPTERTDLRALAADAVLAKPFDLERLVATLDRFC